MLVSLFAARYILQAALAFAEVGIPMERMITDNASWYRSQAFAAAASLLEVNTYRRPYYSNAERLDCLPIFLRDYHYARLRTIARQ